MVWDYSPDTEVAESYSDGRAGFVAMPHTQKSVQKSFGAAASQETVVLSVRQESSTPTLSEIIALGTCAAMREADQHSISLLDDEMDALFDKALLPQKTRLTPSKLSHP